MPLSKDATIPLFGGVWDTTDDEQEFEWTLAQQLRDGLRPGFNGDVDFAALVDGMYLLTSFPIFGVGFTAPKGQIKLSMTVDAYKLEEVSQIVKHTGDKMLVMVFAPESAFRDG